MAALAFVLSIDYIAHASDDEDPVVRKTALSDAGRRVRILSPPMAPGFRDGISRSPTLRRLVDAIDASDGIVYVEYGKCRSGARSCLMGSMTVTGSSRILQVRIQKTQLEDKLVVSLGHELQHAIEVLSEPSVTTSAEMRWLFEKIGIRSGGVFETGAADRVSDEIHRELAARPDAAVTLADPRGPGACAID